MVEALLTMITTGSMLAFAAGVLLVATFTKARIR
jgi:hypothetical protein